MRSLLVVSFPVVLVAAIFQISGCMDPSGGISAELLSEHQTRLVIHEEPEEELQTIADVRNALLGIRDEPHDHDHADHEHEHADHADHDHDGHDHDADEHGDHDHAEHEHEDGDHDHADHDHEHEDGDHDHAEHEHEDGDHDHAEHEHGDHDHAEHDHSEHAHVELPTEPMEVVIVGTVGGLANPYKENHPSFPFAENQAMLFVCDSGTVATIESDHGHAPGEECAFCARHAAETSDMIATVRFVDDQGKILPIEVQQLFDVKAIDTVVIKGMAHINKGGMLIVDAEGLYVRK